MKSQSLHHHPGRRFLTAIYLYSEDAVDLAVIHRIKAEAFENSKVMDHEFYLSDVYGPRLTNSPGYKAAGDWVVKRLKEYGLTNVHEEPWGPFGRSWNYTHYAGHMIAPQYQPLIGFPLAWTPGTDGAVQGDAIYAPLATDADLEKFKGKLKGKVVLTMASENGGDGDGAAGPAADRCGTREPVACARSLAAGESFRASQRSRRRRRPKSARKPRSSARR